ncbi:hypothetical protein [Gynuella sunshinyii]|uniref:Uncharacterized protein n=1 Tax=Gynuella sunshinyii YC6258 TaxID=1445510 RepID=A0A0C5VUL8_9GAMM|nr:hypothetical protein [Gynuella sunshinyii]AJQ94094.1 hypothetical Protein YC6258_02050 [Gynuella sunshinyii YC6258]
MPNTTPPSLESIKHDLNITANTLTGGQAIIHMLTSHDDEKTASIAHAACGFFEHLQQRLNQLFEDLNECERQQIQALREANTRELKTLHASNQLDKNTSTPR